MNKNVSLSLSWKQANKPNRSAMSLYQTRSRHYLLCAVWRKQKNPQFSQHPVLFFLGMKQKLFHEEKKSHWICSIILPLCVALSLPPSWTGCQLRHTERLGVIFKRVNSDSLDKINIKDMQHFNQVTTSSVEFFIEFFFLHWSQYIIIIQERLRTHHSLPLTEWWVRIRWKQWRKWDSNTWLRSSIKVFVHCWKEGKSQIPLRH